jgi:hypothetical protein
MSVSTIDGCGALRSLRRFGNDLAANEKERAVLNGFVHALRSNELIFRETTNIS